MLRVSTVSNNACLSPKLVPFFHEGNELMDDFTRSCIVAWYMVFSTFNEPAAILSSDLDGYRSGFTLTSLKDLKSKGFDTKVNELRQQQQKQNKNNEDASNILDDEDEEEDEDKEEEEVTYVNQATTAIRNVASNVAASASTAVSNVATYFNPFGGNTNDRFQKPKSSSSDDMEDEYYNVVTIENLGLTQDDIVKSGIDTFNDSLNFAASLQMLLQVIQSTELHQYSALIQTAYENKDKNDLFGNIVIKVNQALRAINSPFVGKELQKHFRRC
jgi:hypothetical protein